VTDDPVSIALEEIRECYDKIAPGLSSNPVPYIDSAGDIPRLVATVTALLEGHVAVQTYAWAPENETTCSCGHDGSADCHFEADSGGWLCRCQPEGFICGFCNDNLIDTDAAEWPCEIYTTAAEALFGEEFTT
jgi:hypothetical protein